MRWLHLLWRIAGWLLAPLVVWAVSLWGAWLAFTLTGGVDNPRHALYIAFAAALVLGTIALLLWMRVLRVSPRLRRSLRVTRDGLPQIDELETPSDTGESPTSRVAP